MLRFFGSTIGKKVIVAFTGFMMFGFLVGHLLGNLQIFLGAQKFNAYAEFLHKNPGLIWGSRITLLAAIALHILCTIQLTKRNRSSRPEPYVNHQLMQATWASGWMVPTGAFIAAYIVYHILHFTTGQAHPDFVAGDVYRNVIVGFSHWPASLFYIVAMMCIGLHLYHGIWSIFQTLGLNHEKYNGFRKIVASLISVFITVGFISIPVVVLLGGLQ